MKEMTNAKKYKTMAKKLNMGCSEIQINTFLKITENINTEEFDIDTRFYWKRFLEKMNMRKNKEISMYDHIGLTIEQLKAILKVTEKINIRKYNLEDRYHYEKFMEKIYSRRDRFKEKLK